LLLDRIATSDHSDPDMNSPRNGRRICAALVVAAAVALALGLVGTVSAKPKPKHKPKPHAKVFDKGCWRGKGTFEYTATENGATVTFSKGTVTFLMQVFKSGNALGDMDVTAHGSADFPAVNGSGEMNITGSFNLTGKASHPIADGAYHLEGTIISSGYAVPIAWDTDASGPLTIKKATATTASGSWGDVVDWTAKRTSAECH
jgi:hypothetical protein